MTLVQFDGMQEVLAEIDVAEFEQPHDLAARSLTDLHLNLRITLGVTVQEAGQHTFDMLWRAGDLEDACIPATQQLSLLFDGVGAIEKHAAAGDQLLTFTGHEKPAPDPIEKSQTEFVFEIDDLPRQGRLGNPQAQGCL